MVLDKINCEVCGECNKEVLHIHHIIYRSDIRSDNSDFNTCILCANHHNMLHANTLKIIGVWPSTAKNGRKLIYVKDGVCNIPGFENETPPHLAINESMKIYDKGINEKS